MPFSTISLAYQLETAGNPTRHLLVLNLHKAKQTKERYDQGNETKIEQDNNSNNQT